ncbi:cytochrome P450 [Streptomyces sp. NBC_01005]|uniref:cytochrome P450 family protein n=1 Tax=unclassified Streptomyces TaxID=2593676 RepID=UPI002E36B0AC|nr:cytochrome P450 [Streptomyces sp. NBC_01362]WSW03332.1 cytochrome P450 [Streptomyces sp. NBC_01005]WTC92834.1 cytochrome P450 [Streptomyces sp. NBC_01650]
MTAEDHGTAETDGEPLDLAGEELVRDPFAAYAPVREREQMVRGRVQGVDPMWVATRHEDIRTVMSDSRFTIDAATVPGAPVAHRTEQTWQARGMYSGHEKYLHAGIFDADGTDHRRIRGLVTAAFSPGRVAALRPRIEAIADRLLDRLPGHAENGVVDLVEHFARPLPITVICELIAVPEADRDRWRERSATLTAGICGDELGAALAGMVEDAHALVDHHADHPGNDLISELLAPHHHDRLSTDELVALITNLVVAGHITTVNLIANSTEALLTHPDQLALLREDATLMPHAVNELMRYCGPVVRALPRYATCDTTVGNTPVRIGEAVLPIVSAANRDPAAFTDPDRLDLGRTRSGRESHLGFGHGAHRCLGAPLAQEETAVALTALLSRFPDLQLTTDPKRLQRGTNPVNWHLKALPVRLRPQS